MDRASAALRILVTGFGAFPGVHSNPTEALVRALEAHRARLARLGIELELAILPVSYTELPQKLEALTEAFRPDAILHLGLATRRKRISIETRAMNRLSLLRPDATGSMALWRQILPGRAMLERSTFPAAEIDAALDRAGVTCRLSHNAGNYICNQALYLSLAKGAARQVGFIHVPPVAGPNAGRSRTCRHSPTIGDLTKATLTAILVMARKLGTKARPPSPAPETAEALGGALLDRMQPLA